MNVNVNHHGYDRKNRKNSLDIYPIENSTLSDTKKSDEGEDAKKYKDKKNKSSEYEGMFNPLKNINIINTYTDNFAKSIEENKNYKYKDNLNHDNAVEIPKPILKDSLLESKNNKINFVHFTMNNNEEDEYAGLTGKNINNNKKSESKQNKFDLDKLKSTTSSSNGDNEIINKTKNKKNSLLRRTTSVPKLIDLNNEYNENFVDFSKESNSEYSMKGKHSDCINNCSDSTKDSEFCDYKEDENIDFTELDSAYNELYFYLFENILIDFLKLKFNDNIINKNN